MLRDDEFHAYQHQSSFDSISKSFQILESFEKLPVESGVEDVKDHDITRKLVLDAMENQQDFILNFHQSILSLSLKIDQFCNIASKPNQVTTSDSVEDLELFYEFSNSNFEVCEELEKVNQQFKSSLESHQQFQSLLLKDHNILKLWIHKLQGYSHNILIIPWAKFCSTFYPPPTELSESEEISMKELLDPMDDGYVSGVSYTQLVSLFGATKELPTKVKELTDQLWFHGFLDDEVAQKLIRNNAPLTFLVHLEYGRIDRVILEYVKLNGIPTRLVLNYVETPNGRSYIFEEIGVKLCLPLLELFKVLVNNHAFFPFPEKLNNSKFLWKQPLTDTLAFDLLNRCPHLHLTSGLYVGYISSQQEESLITFISYYDTTFHTIKLEKCGVGYSSVKNVESKSSEHIVFKSIEEFVNCCDILSYPLSSSFLPPINNEPFVSSGSVVTIRGPPITPEPSFIPLNGFLFSDESAGIACRTLSTYPRDSMGEKVICDAFRVKKRGGIVSMVLCDGCNWGTRSRDAAQMASKYFINSISDETALSSLKNTNDMQIILKKALLESHKAISSAQNPGEPTWNAGTTTLIGGYLFKIQKLDKWGFLFISVGDCKAFHWDSKTYQVIDITSGNRASISNPSDPGGRIGPYMGDEPDLRNMNFYFKECNHDDLIMMVTDGVYDNMDPEHYGWNPNEIECGVSCDNWSKLDSGIAHKIKEYFLSQKMASIISTTNKTSMDVAYAIAQNSVNVTTLTRDWMEANPSQTEPKDYKLFPGKMDHTTCIVVKIKDTGKEKKLLEILSNSSNIDRSPSILLNLKDPRLDPTKSESLSMRLMKPLSARKEEVEKSLKQSRVSKMLNSFQLKKSDSPTKPSESKLSKISVSKSKKEPLVECYQLIILLEKTNKVGKELSLEVNKIFKLLIQQPELSNLSSLLEVKRLIDRDEVHCKIFERVKLDIVKIMEDKN